MFLVYENLTQPHSCTWGEHSDIDSIQAFQRAITTRYPPPHSGVTQYTTHIKSTLTTHCSVWTQAINNAYDDNILPHPLHNTITIFNIHHRNNFTTLVTNNHTYQYYEPLKAISPYSNTPKN